MRKERKKANGYPSRSANDRQLVEALTAKGLSGDVISELLNVNKNRLRREHAVALHIGRMKAKKQKAATKARDMTRAEMHAANAILVAFADEEWVDPAICFGLASTATLVQKLPPMLMPDGCEMAANLLLQASAKTLAPSVLLSFAS